MIDTFYGNRLSFRHFAVFCLAKLSIQMLSANSYSPLGKGRRGLFPPHPTPRGQPWGHIARISSAVSGCLRAILPAAGVGFLLELNKALSKKSAQAIGQRQSVLPSSLWRREWSRECVHDTPLLPDCWTVTNSTPQDSTLLP
ncbi:hypothetical protein PoB_005022300 [Plakobranchus ocellatus]|uniref:Uncharacterized protein n=1 Tax=Plakobranchus ocellatus TaxID=259542 RepID=A0AAV4BWX3_9GAST|nr:hypothetical protein PoB_005022300 [Plakobranchus ocellatus]